MTDTPEDIRAKAKGVLCDLADEMEASRVAGGPFWSGEQACAVIAQAIMEERNSHNQDKPATTIYGNLLWHHMQAARKDFDGPERKRIFDLIDAFRVQYPEECKVWEDRYPGSPDKTEAPHG